ncbi:MAG: DUF4416 family protein [Bdellovibrionota bacterium]|nr:DUF4416 family protein [Bdellovibrionota bacterium]
MSLLQTPTKTFFFASFLFRRDLVSEDSIKTMWEKKWGESLYFDHPFFPMKKYYSKEMGDSNLLQRLFGVSLNLQNRESFVQGKVWSTGKEIEMSQDKLGVKFRTVNIDLGCLSLENMQLATGKPYSHRIYLGKGVYSDLTYVFQNKSYKPLLWTYPDYREEEIIKFFNSVRKVLHKKILDLK